MVFCIYNVESNIGKTRDENRRVSRNSEHGDYACKYETIWREAHIEVLFVGIFDQGLPRNAQKVRSGQGDERMDDEGVLNFYPLLMTMTATNTVMNDWNTQEGKNVKVKRTNAVLKRAMAEKRSK